MSNRPGVRNAANAIEFDRVSRRFTIHHERRESLQDWFIHRFLPDRAAAEKLAEELKGRNYASPWVKPPKVDAKP